MNPSGFSFHASQWQPWAILILLLVVLGLALLARNGVQRLRRMVAHQHDPITRDEIREQVDELSAEQIDELLSMREQRKKDSPNDSTSSNTLRHLLLLLLPLLPTGELLAQDGVKTSVTALFRQPGIIITIVLILLPVLAGMFIMYKRISRLLQSYGEAERRAKAKQLAEALADPDDITAADLQRRKAALSYHLHNDELSGNQPAEDNKGLVHINAHPGLPVVPLKKKAAPRPRIQPALSRLILSYLVCATAWLILGTTVGEYLGIKFVAPDADHLPWLSFGRLRPVHTNAVFWGWASLAMLGLGYYIVPRVSNTSLYSIRNGWYALAFINSAVLAGSLSLMAGINNGGGEYREYTWPVMLLFAIGLVLTLHNFLHTIARRGTKEIYISNWYIVSAIMFGIVITIVAYIPWWQNGLGETIVQGYYMHQGVGMWFMLFTLGIVYYFLPQQLNKPIYSYSLGILAFWSQIFFYTTIGTHHFVFSAIPWWLQTVAIVGSVGMIIPVLAGTTNFIMSFRGAWDKVRDSYTLPFFLTGIVFYFSGSLQGTAEAFRFTNQVWHFTDFTVAHSHLTMYGIISFFAWAAIYAVVPRLTGREAPTLTIGIHFWLALIGLLVYTLPLMIGSTLRGLHWMEGKPFVESVSLMIPYWIWRAIGGSMMWAAHLVFAYNMYRMMKKRRQVTISKTAIRQLVMEPAPLN
ncbi:cbb3-type cytochrome c oxidase subunit I [Paraflavitalea pollutisoli]|uniref:cbb3-type cytochrome c oxidase subunit I n=1 Tax=Paraflavitalea pollutisoli TaxID=3034143 RepID=UPI0023EDEA9C|nr:cbb3-type cytochrome c oxidase subunit I [Paraflavitalea sp. H1-2-19X]